MLVRTSQFVDFINELEWFVWFLEWFAGKVQLVVLPISLSLIAVTNRKLVLAPIFGHEQQCIALSSPCRKDPSCELRRLSMASHFSKNCFRDIHCCVCHIVCNYIELVQHSSTSLNFCQNTSEILLIATHFSLVAHLEH